MSDVLGKKQISSPLVTVILGIRTILLTNGVSKILMLAVEFFIAHSLGAAFFGLYAITVSMIVVLTTICMFGINYGIVQFLPIYEEQKDKESQKDAIIQVIAFLLITGSIAGSGLYYFQDYIIFDFFEKPQLKPLFLIAACIIPIETINYGLGSVFRGLGQFKNYMVCVDLLRNIALFVFFPLSFIVSDIGLEQVFYLYLVGAVFGLFYGLYHLAQQKLLKSPLQFNLTVFIDLVKFSYLLFVFNLFQVLSLRLLTLAAGFFLTSSETGIFGVAVRLTLLIVFFQTAVNSTIHTEFSRCQYKGENTEQKNLYQNVTRGLLCVCFFVSIGFLVAPDYVLHFVGAEYAEYGWLVLPLFMATLFNVVTGPAGQLLVANSKQSVLLKLSLMDMLMTFCMVIPMVYIMGIKGLIIGEAIRLTVFVTIRQIVVYRLFKVHAFTKSYLMIALGLMGCVCLIVAINVLAWWQIHPLFYIIAAYILSAGWIGFIIATHKDMRIQILTVLRIKTSDLSET